MRGDDSVCFNAVAIRSDSQKPPYRSSN